MTPEPSGSPDWRGWTIYFDANILIYAMENDGKSGALARGWLRQVDLKAISAVTSELTALEVLPSVLRRGNRVLADSYRRILGGSAPLRVANLTSDTVRAAIDVRALLGCKTADALHVASALAERCDAILTNDGRMRLPSRLVRLSLSEVKDEGP